ncbi:hypothetical protein R3P38DRAFT_2794630 [Favolaschia claudopus]|uniref:Uncharacterized protein n=1 Tax=Favolaschia claudopus TaxID=2862362 RepID=A0AAW0A9K0_9AGAR
MSSPLADILVFGSARTVMRLDCELAYTSTGIEGYGETGGNGSVEGIAGVEVRKDGGDYVNGIRRLECDGGTDESVDFCLVGCPGYAMQNMPSTHTSYVVFEGLPGIEPCHRSCKRRNELRRGGSAVRFWNVARIAKAMEYEQARTSRSPARHFGLSEDGLSGMRYGLGRAVLCFNFGSIVLDELRKPRVAIVAMDGALFAGATGKGNGSWNGRWRVEIDDEGQRVRRGWVLAEGGGRLAHTLPESPCRQGWRRLERSECGKRPGLLRR